MEKKELELNALLEVTEAINANLPEESLYKIFYFICISNLSFKKLALVVYEDENSCKVNHGIEITEEAMDYLKTIEVSQRMIALTPEQKAHGLLDVDLVVPVSQKDKKLAKILLGGIDDAHKYSVKDLSFVQTLANVIMVAIENKRLARGELRREAIRREMEIARKVQSLLFPKSLPDDEEVSLFSSYLPHFSVGGDYYDYVRISDDQFFFCIADVSGKGVPAALIMSNFQASFRTLTRQTDNLTIIINELNHQLITNSNGEHFITFFVGKYDMQTRKLKYVNAGHNAPIVLAGEKIETLSTGTTVLGAFDKLPFLTQGETILDPNSLIFLYTDGITETSNDSGEEYGEERLEEFLVQSQHANLSELHQDLIINLDNFKESQGYSDDLTVLSCRIA